MEEKKDAKQVLRKIIAEQLGCSIGDIQPETKFVDNLGADSIDLLELTMAVEEEYDIMIPSEEADTITTVAQLEAVVLREIELRVHLASYMVEDEEVKLASAEDQKVYDSIAANYQYGPNELFGEVRDGVVVWFDQNPHAYPEGTRFYAQRRREPSNLKPGLYDDLPPDSYF